jgi:regulatory protein
MTESNIYQAALSRAMMLCSQREYCVDDIRSKLHSWGVGDNESDRVISTLIKENFINEVRYAEAFVRDKFRHNKWGKVKIAAHLRTKQLPSEVIKSALDSIDDKLYSETMREIILSHRRSVKAKNQYDLKGKLLRYGLSKGFESNLLYDLLNDF